VSTKKPYEFDPVQYGFKPVSEFPELAYIEHKHAFVKVICRGDEQQFGRPVYWYTSCYQLPDQDRWHFGSGVWDKSRLDRNHGSSTIYVGCITSDEYARQLLIHLFGTLTNEGTLKHGPERLAAASL
jgi:hypothetical protein